MVDPYIAQGMKPYNAANTLALAENIRGVRNSNALTALQLKQEQDPGSFINRAREIDLQQGSAQAEALARQNAVPRLSAALTAMGTVKRTIANKGVAAGRQRLSEQLSFLKSQGILPKDFDLGVNPDELSDEDFLSEIEQSEQSISDTLAGLVPSDESRTSAAIGDMQALGYPMTPEGFQQYNDDKGSGTSEGLEALIAEARLRGLISEQDAAAADRVREAEERRRALEATETSVIRNLEQNQEAVRLTQRLEGTMLESGSFLPSDFQRGLATMQRLVQSISGEDTTELDLLIGEFDTQRKLLQDQVNARIASGEYGRSATQLSSIERSLANQDISPTAIIRIQGQLGQMDLDRADAAGAEIENRDEYERQIKEWKSYSPVSPANILKMTEKQIRGLDLDSLTDEQAKAAIERIRSLRSAGP